MHHPQSPSVELTLAQPRPLRGDLLLPSAVLVIPPPDFLSPQAREHWGDLVRVLGPSGLLSELDGMSLSLLCENLSDYWGLRRELENLAASPAADGEDKGRTMLSLRLQCAKVLGDMDGRIRGWLGELLMTPASRARSQPVRPPIEEQEVDLSELDAEERVALRGILEKRQSRASGKMNGNLLQ